MTLEETLAVLQQFWILSAVPYHQNMASLILIKINQFVSTKHNQVPVITMQMFKQLLFGTHLWHCLQIVSSIKYFLGNGLCHTIRDTTIIIKDVLNIFLCQGCPNH